MILRVVGCLCVLLLVWLSWIPREWEIRTGLAGQIEHFVAYCGTGACLAWAFGRSPSHIAVALVALAGILEIGQIWVPGRTSQFVDFAASGAGALTGVALGVWARRVVAPRRVGAWMARVGLGPGG